MTLRPQLVAMSLAALLAGCAGPERPVETPPATVEPAKPARVESRNTPPRQLASRRLKPMPVRPLNASANCDFRDETGYKGSLHLDVQEATVQRFDARVHIPKRGSCRFHLRDFAQIGAMPAVVLTARESKCTVSLWEQGTQVTVAFRDCRRECSGASADYLWPILVDRREGSCS